MMADAHLYLFLMDIEIWKKHAERYVQRYNRQTG